MRFQARLLLELQFRFGDEPLKFHVVCPQHGFAVLTGALKDTGTFRLSGSLRAYIF